MGWKEQLKPVPLEWLLEQENPEVRFWALQDLLDHAYDDPEVIEAQEAAMEQPPIKTILDAQEPEGYWVHEEDMYLPKYRATTHQLLILAELGAIRTPGIEKAIEHVFQFQRYSGHFLTKLPKTERGRASKMTDGCCLDGNILYYLNHFCYLDDARTQKLLEFLVEDHDSEKAGWKCRAFPINPDAVFPANCYMGATKVLKAFSYIPEEERSPEIKSIIGREVENILENHIYKYLRNPDGTRKVKAGWKRFGFPIYYQSDVLEVLDTLTRLGVVDERMEPTIELVKSVQGDDGRWLLKHTFNGKMWIDIEEKHKPSKWITLRALRVLKRFYGD